MIAVFEVTQTEWPLMGQSRLCWPSRNSGDVRYALETEVSGHTRFAMQAPWHPSANARVPRVKTRRRVVPMDPLRFDTHGSGRRSSRQYLCSSPNVATGRIDSSPSSAFRSPPRVLPSTSWGGRRDPHKRPHRLRWVTERYRSR